MTGFSNPERRGLQQMQAAGAAHPDADLLTAFSEQTLTARERQQVLAHLATCAECREVIALAAPPVPETASVAEARPAFWKWPVLRWGAVAASAALVLVIVSVNTIQRKQVEPQHSMVGAKTEPTAPIPMSKAPSAADLNQPEGAPASADKGAVAGLQKPQVRYEKLPAESPSSSEEIAARVDRARDLSAANVEMTQAKVAAETAAAVPAPPPPVGRPETARVGGANMNMAMANIRTESRNDADALAQKKEVPIAPQAQAAPQADTFAYSVAPPAQANVEAQFKSKPNLQGGAAPMAAAPGRQAQGLAKARQTRYAAPTNWNISSDGYLQRSFDHGLTWERALPEQKFSAVAFIRNSIWAGGAKGVLMHSADAGQTWAPISPASAGATIQGDITAIRFTDANHGLVSTSTGETWSTADGGSNWTKQ
ncbi:MAG TPA: YCF48-related protein [Terriglobales bacterium]|nr:YCF48-related protein [Terriglobales bacterium]